MATVAATGTSSQAGREARRRRILERGSDRLALITGRIESLPPDPEQSRPQASLPGQTPADSAQHENNIVSGPSLMNCESGKDPSQCHIPDETEEHVALNHNRVENISSREAGESLALDNDEGKNTTSQETKEPPTLNGNKHKDITSRAASLLGIEEELSRISSSARSLTQGHQRTKNLCNSQTTGQVCSAIAATENIRIFSSVAAAILVILSYTGLPIMSSPGVRNIVLLRPVYLLLLTNVSIVLARVITTQNADSRTPQRNRASVIGVGKAIEAGLLLQNILAALFMDFGIYAILLVCGHSLIQRLGW